MTRSNPELQMARDLLCRAIADLLVAQRGDAAAYERLLCTLDELCAATMATDHEAATEVARAALPELTEARSAEAFGPLAELLEGLRQALDLSGGCTPLDAETVALFLDFITESVEGLERVDQVLLSVDRAPASAEQINELFRVFHTIKGVSGFLEASDVTRVAHVTETLLDQVRSGTRELKGAVLEVVFESTAALRRLLEVLRTALGDEQRIPSDPATDALVARVDALIAERDSAQPGTLPAATSSAAPATVGDGPGVERDESLPAVAKLAGGPKLRETIKVDLERIDNVVEMIGELIIVEAMVAHAPEVQSMQSLKIRNYLSQLAKISRDLQSVAMRMRMVPVRGVFQKMARMTRDLARKTGKTVVLEQLGDGTEMDRSMVERIEDPLMHMIRNAIDHAIEEPAERTRAGKAKTGALSLEAKHEGGSVVIELRDDGRGLRRERIIAKAQQRGLVGAEAEQLSDDEVFSLIFLPGFSTAEQVSELSGRGVGMDVVKRAVESMRGRVTVTSQPGVGTTFRLILPLTLAIIDGMLVQCGSERYIIPSLAIVESLQPRAGMVRTVGVDGELINVRGEILPLLRLGRLFQLPPPELAPEHARVVVVESAGRKVGLLVDDVLTQQQIVIKPLAQGLGDTELLSGAAILSDGRVGLIVNVDRLNGLLGHRRSHYESGEVAA